MNEERRGANGKRAISLIVWDNATLSNTKDGDRKKIKIFFVPRETAFAATTNISFTILNQNRF